MDVCETYNERAARRARGISSHELRGVCGFSSHMPKEFTCKGRENEELKRKVNFNTSDFHDNVNAQDEALSMHDTIEEAVRNGKLAEFVNQGVSQKIHSSRGDPKDKLKDSCGQWKRNLGSNLRCFSENGVEGEGIKEGEPTVRFRKPPHQDGKYDVTTFCMKIKFSTKTGVRYMQSNQRTVKQCHMLSEQQGHEQEQRR
ncbi:hypothetical protein PVK06_034705 [Gossypium arboreum]|uniref:Uncharacterized protein n=1 Tax=Gossypium arboreum TaxID=29729 RepID=A0ABR0NFE6_GOSAR|nr:hypothetical protein PVK06_034705 [Gossypium arboreum]